MKKIYFTIAILIAACLKLSAQQIDPIKQNYTVDIDKTGDAHVSITTTFNNNTQWDNFKSYYGSNALELLKREDERLLPGYYMQNWDYKDDPSEHSYTLSFDALGYARIDDNSNWVITIDQKKPDITKISDHNYAMTTTLNSYGIIIQQIWKINLPGGANNVTQDKDAFGKTIFTYEMSPSGKASSLIFIIMGILFLAAAVVLYFKPDLLKFGKKQQVKPFTVVTSQPAAVAPINPEPPAASPDIEKQA